MIRKATCALVASCLLLSLKAAFADPISFMADPMSVEVTAEPGVSDYNGIITVSNTAPASSSGLPAAPVRLRVYQADWQVDRTGTPQIFKPQPSPDSCSSWIQVTPMELDVPGGESRDVRYTIKVPAGAQGTFHTMLLFEAAPIPSVMGGRPVGLSGRIGSAIYVQVGPQVKRLRVTQFSFSDKKVALTVQNTGNSHVRLKGTLQFRDQANHLVQQIPIPGAVVLPGQGNVRDFSLSVPALAPGAYTVTAIIDYGGETLIGARTHVTLP